MGSAYPNNYGGFATRFRGAMGWTAIPHWQEPRSLLNVNAAYEAAWQDGSGGRMRVRTRFLAGLMGISLMLGGLAPSAHALFKRHRSEVPKVRRAKKNSNPYAYLARKKQKKHSGYYRSTLTGKVVYGKRKR
jgi:hypothetical protein